MTANELAKQLLGLHIRWAKYAGKAMGYRIRIVGGPDSSYVVTRDYVANRVNVKLSRDGNIIESRIG